MQWIGKTEQRAARVVDDRRYRLETLALVMRLEAIKLQRAARGMMRYSEAEAVAVVRRAVGGRVDGTCGTDGTDGAGAVKENQ